MFEFDLKAKMGFYNCLSASWRLTSRTVYPPLRRGFRTIKHWDPSVSWFGFRAHLSSAGGVWATSAPWRRLPTARRRGGLRSWTRGFLLQIQNAFNPQKDMRTRRKQPRHEVSGFTHSNFTATSNSGVFSPCRHFTPRIYIYILKTTTPKHNFYVDDCTRWTRKRPQRDQC